MRNVLLTSLLVPALALAAPPSLLNFTGTVSDTAGPVTDGSYSVTLRFFGAATGGSLLWTDTQDVTTSGGVFNFMLGGGTTAFDETLLNQAQLWLELEVDGDLMSPRLRTVSVPYALQAAAALSADSLNCNGCVSGQQIDTAEVQTRVTGTCSAGSAVTGIGATGDVSCVPTMQLAGTGTSPTAAHADHDHDGIYLFEGPTLACLGTDKVAGIDAATGNVICAPDVDTDTAFIEGAGISIVGTTVAVSFAGTACPGTDKMVGFDALGAPTCAPDIDTDTDTLVVPTQIPGANVLVTADNLSGEGRFTSITIGTDGLPVISYRETGATLDLRILKCTAQDCSTGAAISPDGLLDVGEYTSIAIGADGNPVVSYYDLDPGSTALKFVRCADPACTSTNPPVFVDITNDRGRYSSLAIGGDGLPVIAYRDETAQTLRVAHCTDAGCTLAADLNQVDGANTGQFASIAIGVDGLPVISYRVSTLDDLKVAKCNDAACASATLTTQADSAESVGKHTSITVAPDGLPVIAYARENAGPEFDLKVAKCPDPACAGAATITAVDTSGDVGQFASITIGADGLPAISYHDATAGTLRFLHCGRPDCSTGNAKPVVDNGGGSAIVGEYTSVTIGADGLPVISYRDFTNTALKVAKCANALCLPNWTRR